MAFGAWAILQKHANIQLPQPDYSKSIEETYEVFTRSLLGATGSLEFIQFAAAQSIATSPPWVPDWSAKDRQVFGDPEDHLNSLEFNYLSRAHPEQLSNTKYWSFRTDNNSILTVRARHLGTVSSVHRFFETNATINNQQDACHVQNMELMQFLRLHPTWSKRMYWQDFSKWLFEIFSVDIPDDCEALSVSRLRDWSYSCLMKGRISCARAIQCLRGSGHMAVIDILRTSHTWTFHYTRYKDVLETHIAICNVLARSKKAVFETPSPIRTRSSGKGCAQWMWH